MSIGDSKLEALLDQLAPVILPPAEYPPTDVVRDTPREEIDERIKNNASEIGLALCDEHWEVINFLFDFHENCCQSKAPHYLDQKHYWEYIDYEEDQETISKKCLFGQLSTKEAIKAHRVYRILLKAYKNQGGKRHLYKLFPSAPLFTIHLLV